MLALQARMGSLGIDQVPIYRLGPNVWSRRPVRDNRSTRWSGTLGGTSLMN